MHCSVIHAHQIKTYNSGACHLNGLCTSTALHCRAGGVF